MNDGADRHGEGLGHSQAADAPRAVVFFDGVSSRRHTVRLVFDEQLAIHRDDGEVAVWPYADIRSIDSPPGTFRVGCLGAPPLARLDIRDSDIAGQLAARCTQLDRDRSSSRGVLTIVGWSVAATVSIIVVTLFGIPLAADRVTPLVPSSFERRLGDVSEQQIRALFGGKNCQSKAGQAAFSKLVKTVRTSVGLDTSVDAFVLSSAIPNALALPGGKVILFNGLLARANNPDEIAGVLAHELGHLKHRDSMRHLIHDGAASFLIGLLFGDITGSSVLIFASRTVVTASYSRDAEHAADTVSIEAMRQLGRSPRPMGELLFRITGRQGDRGVALLAGHPLTEDRLARMKAADTPPNGTPLLSPEEWRALKAICN